MCPHHGTAGKLSKAQLRPVAGMLALGAAPWLLGSARGLAPLAASCTRRRHGAPPRPDHQDAAVGSRGRPGRSNHIHDSARQEHGQLAGAAVGRLHRTWEEPGAFRPERFRDWDQSAFSLVPQGGGDYDTGHRCAGEWLTIALMKRAVRLLTTGMHYDVPPQDLRIDLSRLPAVPKSRFVIRDVALRP